MLSEIAALKCMDGRLHLSVITSTPFGIIQPFRNIGGQCDMGVPKCGGVVLMTSAISRNGIGIEKQLAAKKALSLAKFAKETIRRTVPELMPYLSLLMGTVDMNTRLFTPVPFKK